MSSEGATGNLGSKSLTEPGSIYVDHLERMSDSVSAASTRTHMT